MRPAPSPRQLALWVAVAAALQTLESLFPLPLPGARLGLANAVTLLVLARFGWRPALEVALLRVVCGALLLGTLFTPAFVLSAAAALTSTLAMGFLRRWLPTRLSVVGLSVAGAAVHTLTQIFVVWALFLPQAGVWWLAPWLGLIAVATGWVTGLAACSVGRWLDRPRRATAGIGLQILAEPSLAAPQGVVSARWRLAALAVMFLSLLCVPQLTWHFLILSLVLVLLLVSRISWREWAVTLKRLAPWLVLAAAASGFGWWGGKTDWNAAGGPALGLLRLTIALLGAAWLSRTSRPLEIASALEPWLAPLRLVGYQPSRAAQALALALHWAPCLRQWFVEETRRFRGEARLHRRKWPFWSRQAARLLASVE
jgi:heptaprenyl diphosphate synthase